METRSKSGVALHEVVARLFGVDARTLALFRVGVAGLVVVDVLSRFPDLVAHYTDAGILLRAAARAYEAVPVYFSLYFVHGGALWPAVLLGLTLLSALAMFFGVRTRWATVITWFLLTSLQVRNPGVLNSGDGLLRLLLFWGMMLPLGLEWSFDRAMAVNQRWLPRRVVSFASAGLQLQVAFVYLFTWLLKTGEPWLDGTAVEMALRYERLATPLGKFALNYPDVLVWLTHGVYWFELFGAVLLFVPFGVIALRSFSGVTLLRTGLIAAFVLMHVGFAAFMSFGFFPFVSMVSVLVFVPGGVWDRWVSLERGGKNLTIYYDGGCSFCLKMTSLLKTFLVLPQARVIPAQEDPEADRIMREKNTWVVENPDGMRFTHGNALRVVIGVSPLLGFLRVAWLIPGFTPLANRVYAVVAANRPDARSTARVWVGRALPRRTSIFLQGVAAVALFYILIWNITGVTGEARPLAQLGYGLRVSQHWSMFSPHPPTEAGWFSMTGYYSDGSNVDLLAAIRGESRPGTAIQPADHPKVFLNNHWSKFTSNMKTPDSKLAAPFADYLCRAWSSETENGATLLAVSIHYYRYRSMEGLGEDPPEFRVVANKSCADLTAG